VAGGVFAQQGEWSLSGMLEIGTRVDFDPQPDVDQNDPALVDGIAFNEYDGIQGKLAIGYNRDSINVGLAYSTMGGTTIDTTFDGENFKGQLKVNGLTELIANSSYNSTNLDRLWGEFKFIDGMITLVPAFNSPDTEYWVSDKTGTLGGANARQDWKTAGGNPFGNGDTFTKVNHKNYLLAGAEIGALGFGIKIPDLFTPDNGAWASYGTKTGNASSGKFIDSSIRQIIFGVSFEQSPFEFAAQFYIEKYGIYFGGKFFAGPITVGLSFMGELDGDGKKYTDAAGNVIAANDADPKFIKIGGGVDYDGSGFGAGLKVFYSRDDDVIRVANVITGKTNYYWSEIGVEPYFFYDAIPSHLQFRLDAGMFFLTKTDGNDSAKGTVWALQPQLAWNFLGTGAATGYYNIDTGIFFRYRLAGADLRDDFNQNLSANILDVIFKWSF